MEAKHALGGELRQKICERGPHCTMHGQRRDVRSYAIYSGSKLGRVDSTDCERNTAGQAGCTDKIISQVTLFRQLIISSPLWLYSVYACSEEDP